MDYEREIQKLNDRMDDLQRSFIQAQKNQVPVTAKADSASNKIPQVDENTSGVEENDEAICDVAELADTNSIAIDDLAELVDELLSRVEALEGKE